jgi:hypothetical protein
VITKYFVVTIIHLIFVSSIRKDMRKYTESQIARAKAKYENAFAYYHTTSNYNVASIGMTEAHYRADYHNQQVDLIKAGDKDTVRYWKLFFLNQEFDADLKATRLAAAREEGKNNLAKVKAAGKKMADYYNFVKNHKRYSREFYSKKYTAESVDAFLLIA